MELKLVTKDTDLSKCNISYLNWDVNIGGRDYTVCRIEGYPHGEGGKFGENCYYCFPANEEPCYENLINWWSDVVIRWGIKIESRIRVKYKWNEVNADNNYLVIITRNDQEFYSFSCRDLDYGMSKAKIFITEVQENVINVCERGFDKKLVGRKILYCGMPAVIVRYIWGSHSIWIEADNEEGRFEFPEYMKDEYGYWEEYQDGMSVECLSDKIEWFPREK